MKIKNFLKTKGLKMLIIVVVLALFLLIANVASAGKAGFLTDSTNAVAAPFRKAATAMSDFLENMYGYLYEYEQLQAENETLKTQLAAAQAEVRAGLEDVEENERLKELLNLHDDRPEFVFESAKIVSRSTSNWERTFTISKGESSGIELGDCVINESGALVGQISELGENWATVRTVIDVDVSIGAHAGISSTTGMIMGEFSLMQQGYSKLTYLTDTSNVAAGDTVLTSGKGGYIPQGLIIGTITELRSEAGGQMIFGVVEPVCDLDSISQVFIILEHTIVAEE